jgi:hypothetical protein
VSWTDSHIWIAFQWGFGLALGVRVGIYLPVWLELETRQAAKAIARRLRRKT